MKRFVSSLLLLSCIYLSGCSLVPHLEPVAPNPGISWKEGSDVVESCPEEHRDWWKSFGDRRLEALIERGLVANRDLASALERVKQARAQATISGASLWPRLDISGSASRIDNDSSSSSSSTSNNDFRRSGSNSSYTAGPALSYELDLWGGNAAQRDAGRARALAEQFQAADTYLLVTTEIARTYLSLLTLNDQLTVAIGNRRVLADTLALIDARFDAGSISALERAQQRTVLSAADAAIAALELQKAQSENALAVLIGTVPSELGEIDGSIASISVPTIAPFAPAQLLTRRPDIARAEADLVAANFDIGVARAALYPSLQLSLDSLLRATEVNGPSTLTHQVMAALTAPVFRGWALTAERDRAEARKAELVYQYQQAVLTAARDVEDSIAFIRTSGIRLDHLSAAVVEARSAQDIAQLRFKVGSTDFLPLLETQRALLQSEDAEIRAMLDQRLAALQLYRALGGGWAPDDNSISN